ncbi:MAG: hypothetical protein ACD_10C00639G0001 [uncultured bacterium]|nr:MAG: hypothetical protein ACD_10C00639G0001 [uncultured bacterium]
MEALLVIFDQLINRIHGEPDAGCADVIAGKIEDAVVHKNGQRVAVDHVAVNVDFVIFLHGADAVVPGIALFGRADFFRNAGAGVVIAGFFRDKKTAESAVADFDFLQKPRHFTDVIFALEHPVAQKCIVRHRR